LSDESRSPKAIMRIYYHSQHNCQKLEYYLRTLCKFQNPLFSGFLGFPLSSRFTGKGTSVANYGDYELFNISKII